jgi:hypothetical protein
VSYGLEPAGTITPTIGVYAPIGSESAPIIQFYDSIGLPDLAARSIQYFVDKQHDDGFMQNFFGYMLETEATLWTMGEHFRYTRDLDWLESVRPSIEAAVGYILRNRAAQLAAGAPHGLIQGKTADPEDPFASYMLNGYAALGLARAAELADPLDPDHAQLWRGAADELRSDIRASVFEELALAPVVPLGDGRWVRTLPPWAGHPGPTAFDGLGRRWFSHGTAFTRDSLLGPLWLGAQEVLDANEQLTGELLEYHAELFHEDNVALSQPYYSPHPLLHLRRGEVKRFLRAFYTGLASLADRETYTFWEHFWHASAHKTHEEAWFLMQCRWMLWLEDGEALRLFPGIPRAWLAPGAVISLDGVRSYFGSLDARLEVSTDGLSMEVDVRFDPARAPSVVRVRVPHPTGRRALSASQGDLETATETVVVPVADGRAATTVRF